MSSDPKTTCYSVSGTIDTSVQQMRVQFATDGCEPAVWNNCTFTFEWRVIEQPHQKHSTVESVLEVMRKLLNMNNIQVVLLS
jgi:hypothetical protein